MSLVVYPSYGPGLVGAVHPQLHPGARRTQFPSPGPSSNHVKTHSPEQLLGVLAEDESLDESELPDGELEDDPDSDGLELLDDDSELDELLLELSLGLLELELDSEGSESLVHEQHSTPKIGTLPLLPRC